MEFAPSVTESPDSVLFWGRERVLTAAAATAVAQRADPSFLWLDVRGVEPEEEPYSRLLSPMVPEGRRYSADTSPAMAPGASPLAKAIASVVRAEETDTTIAGLLEFLRLPKAVQVLVSRALPNGRPVTLMITSADRVAHFYLERAQSTRGYVETLRALGVKLVATYAGPVRRDRFAFDHSFRIDTPTAEEWGSAVLSSDRDNLPEGTAGYRPTSLGEIDSVRQVLTGDGREGSAR